jgi:hypothetical protein
MSDERITATRLVPADPATIRSVLSDPDGHVAIDASGMLQGATGRPVSAVGDSFVVHMDREALGDLPMGRYDVTVIVTRLDAECVEWTIHGTVKPPIGHVWGYELEPAAEGGTRVTSYCDWSDAAPQWKSIFPVVGETALRASLGLLERAVVRGYPRPSSTTD